MYKCYDLLTVQYLMVGCIVTMWCRLLFSVCLCSSSEDRRAAGRSVSVGRRVCCTEL